MWAAQRGNYNVLKAMLEREVDIHVTDRLGATGTLQLVLKTLLLTTCLCYNLPPLPPHFRECTCFLPPAFLLSQTPFPPPSPLLPPSSFPPSPALHAAALSGHANCVQLLIQHGAPVDIADYNGHTPLFRACERGHTEVVVLLLRAGAMVELVDGSGRSCLHWAASGGHSVICSSLLHHGLPVDCTDSGG